MSCAKATVFFSSALCLAAMFLASPAKADDFYTVDRKDGDGIVHMDREGSKSLWGVIQWLLNEKEATGSELAFTLTNNAYRDIRVGIYSPSSDAWDFVYLAPYDSWTHYRHDSEPDLVQLFVWNAAKQKWVGKDSGLFGLDVINNYEAYKYAKRDYRLRMLRILR